MKAKLVLGFVVLSVVLGLNVFNTPASAQMLRFDPDPFIPYNQQFTVPLVLESGGLYVKGIEASITFDPALVTLDSVTAGPWYTDSGQSFFFWDYTAPFTYAIHFASAMLDGTSNADGVIALCHFSFAGFGVCPLDFTLVDVRDFENNELTFDSDSGVIYLDEAVETKNVNFTALKAIYR
jgi:hypothetical protein